MLLRGREQLVDLQAHQALAIHVGGPADGGVRPPTSQPPPPLASRSVLSVAWHPNSQLLAITGTDYKCRIISAYIDTLDATYVARRSTCVSRAAEAALTRCRSAHTPSPDGGPFGEASAFNTQLVALDAPNGFWTENVAWSPCGLRLAYVCASRGRQRRGRPP